VQRRLPQQLVPPEALRRRIRGDEEGDEREFSRRIAPKGMRRTSKDLLRAAGVRDIVAMALNSHLDEGMHAHYSTVSQEEMNEAVAKVIHIARYREAMGQ
jgi:hypothetical protein